MNENSKQFVTDAGRFNEVRNKVLKLVVPILFLIAVFFTTMTAVMSKHLNVAGLIIFVLVLFILYAIPIYIGLLKRRKIYESFRLIIDNNTITREQINSPTVIISQSDIKKIIKKANGNIVIKSSFSSITVPAQIQNYSELQELLDRLPINTDNNLTIANSKS